MHLVSLEAVRLLNFLILSLFFSKLQATENVVTLSPTELIVFEGGNAVMSCSPFSRTDPPSLTKQGRIVLKTSTEPRLSFQDFVTPGKPFLSSRTYNISRVTRQDDRTRFRCVIGDFESCETTLLVYVPPELTGPSGQQYVLEGSPLVIFNYSEVLGLPPPDAFIWELNGRIFSGNSRISLLGDNRTFSVRFASRVDSGNYTLTVVSGSGSASLNLELIVTFDEFTKTPRRNIMAEEGEEVTLNCEHRFGLTYSWVTADREPISTLGNKVNIRSLGRTLEYGPVNHTDHQLSFMCVVVSVGEVGFFESPLATLSVKAPPEVSAPEKASAIEGQDMEVILSFTVKSFPPPLSQTYTHNDIHLQSDARITVSMTGELIIRNPSRADAGEYRLTITNSRGTNSAVIILEIFHPPKLSPLVGPQVAQINKSATIPCGAHMEVTGHPPPTYQWVRQNQSALTNLPERFSINTTTGDLILSLALYEDDGTYICNATNSIGTSSIAINLMVLDPPGPPESATVLRVGRTWSHIRWSPPVNKGTLGTISSYSVTAEPRPFNGSKMPLNRSEDRSSRLSLLNSSCIESECETRSEHIPGSEVSVNLTSLIQGLEYSLTLTAFSHGSSLQSAPSDVISFNTLAHVPGVGSVTSAIAGPGSAEVSWTLAYSGGLPVQNFIVEYKRNDSTTWQRAQSEGEELQEHILGTNSSIPPETRFHIVRNLESQEVYEFRVSGSNELGTGDFQHVNEPLLSHEIGVPSPPSQPHITSWKEGCATITANLSKFGSTMEFSLGYILILGDVPMAIVTRIDFAGNFILGEQVEVTVMNITYRGDWQFAMLAMNSLGHSLPSEPSLRARENTESDTLTLTTVGVAVCSVMGVVNILIMAASAIVIRVIGWETKKQKRGLVRRLEIAARDQSECPMSPRSLCTFGDIRSSPDGRSNNLAPLTTDVSVRPTKEGAGFRNCFPLSMV